MKIRSLLSFMICLLLAISLGLTACSASTTSEPGTPSPDSSPPVSSPETPSPETPKPESPAPTEPISPPVDDPVVDDPVKPPTPKPEVGQLTAGIWRDLDNWAFWQGLMNSDDWSPKQAYWGFYPKDKVSVQVSNGANPVADALLVLKDKDGATLWEARSNNKGQAHLFPSMFDTGATPFSLVVSAKGVSATFQDVTLNSQEPLKVELAAASAPENLDLMFVIDTTGSMSDELEYLKVELQDVIARVKKDNANVSLRLSANYYRDEGDTYTVRPFPFTENISEVLAQLKDQKASGGGDYPEALDLALDDALNKHTWRAEAKARLLFLVLDAPPHHESQEVVSRMQSLSKQAAKQGIRIIPIASSGVDKDTEFLLRFMSIATDGTYTFLTNDSGIGDVKIEPTIGDYQVEFLNDLLVRIIRDALK